MVAEAAQGTPAPQNSGETPADQSSQEQNQETQEQETQEQSEETQEEETSEETQGSEEQSEETSEEETEEKSEETEEEESEEPQEVEVDGEKLSIEDLKDAYRLCAKAEEVIADAKSKMDSLNTVVKSLVETPMDTLLNIFTHNLGDRKKAYEHVVGLCEKVVAKHLEWEAMDPNERAAKEKTAEAEELRKKLKEKEDAEASESEKVEVAETAKQLTAEINTALKKGGFEKPTPGAVAKVAEILYRAEESGIEVSMDKAVVAYKRALAKQKAELLKEINPEEIPPEKRKEIAKANIAQIKKGKKPGAKTTHTESEQKDDGPVVIPMSDFQSYIRGTLKK